MAGWGSSTSVISVSNLISGLLSVIVTPVVALGVDRLGFRPTLTALAASLVAVIAITYLAWLRADRATPFEDGAPGDGRPDIDAPDAPAIPSMPAV